MLGHHQFFDAEKGEIWDALERDESARGIARRMGHAQGSLRAYLLDCQERSPRPGSFDPAIVPCRARGVLALTA
jgi:hypothetical protein